jgi:hypothetical protein
LWACFSNLEVREITSFVGTAAEAANMCIKFVICFVFSSGERVITRSPEIDKFYFVSGFRSTVDQDAHHGTEVHGGGVVVPPAGANLEGERENPEGGTANLD